jgi:hypothetical protein
MIVNLLWLLLENQINYSIKAKGSMPKRVHGPQNRWGEQTTLRCDELVTKCFLYTFSGSLEALPLFFPNNIVGVGINIIWNKLLEKIYNVEQ